MIAQARTADRQAGLEIDHRVASAEATGLPDAAFDAALAELLATRFSGDRLAVEHRIFAVVAWGEAGP